MCYPSAFHGGRWIGNTGVCEMQDETVKVKQSGNGRFCRILTFDSATKMAEAAFVPYGDGKAVPEADTSWAGGTRATMYAYLRGEKTPPSKAMIDSLLHKVDAAFRDRDAASWEPSVVGAYPVVPEFLQGVPECMRRREMVESDAAPIRIVMSLSAASIVPADAITKRGAAVAALATRLAEVRPTELWLQAESGHGDKMDTLLVQRFRLDIGNVSASQVAATMAESVFYRQVAIRGAMRHTFPESHNEDSLPIYDEMRDVEKGKAYMMKALGLTESDVYIGNLMPGTTAQYDDPVEWVNKQLEKQREIA